MRVTRRRLLAAAASGTGALATGGAAVAAAGPHGERRRVPFHGTHQAGVTTPMQAHLQFASFDVTASGRGALRDLMRAWSAAAARMCAGEPVGPIGGDPHRAPADTGEAYGLGAARLTVTFGLGPGVFDGRFGLAGQRPAALAELPAFATDRLDPGLCGGDLGVQACADDPQVAFHAIRTLARIGAGAVRQRWRQTGFDKTPENSPAGATGRNLMGFKDGTNNLDASDGAAMRRNVWVPATDGPAWMAGGTYLVTRRIGIRIELWDASDLDEQETDVGRTKVVGAPLGASREFDAADPAKLPAHCHIVLANPRASGSEAERILRRGYSYADGLRDGGRLDAGLFFAAFQRDPRRQFVTIQRRLAADDLLNEYLVHTGSAVFAVPPGARRGGFVGEALLGR